MRLCRVVLMLALWVGLAGEADLKAQVVDDFSSGNFSHTGWRGDTTHFRFTSSSAIPPAQKPALQLYTTGVGTSSIYTFLPFKQKMEWSVWCKLSFNPSPSNYARVYMISNKNFPQNTDESIFIGIGMDDDRVGIYHESNGHITALFTDTNNIFDQSTNQMRISVKYVAPQWFYAIDPMGTNTQEYTDSFIYHTVADTAIIALWCQYTSSNATKFYFDDVVAGVLPEDTIPPILLSCIIPEQQTIRLSFSEALHSSVLNNQHDCFTISGGHKVIVSENVLNQNEIELFSTVLFPD